MKLPGTAASGPDYLMTGEFLKRWKKLHPTSTAIEELDRTRDKGQAGAKLKHELKNFRRSFLDDPNRRSNRIERLAWFVDQIRQHLIAFQPQPVLDVQSTQVVWQRQFDQDSFQASIVDGVQRTLIVNLHELGYALVDHIEGLSEEGSVDSVVNAIDATLKLRAVVRKVFVFRTCRSRPYGLQIRSTREHVLGHTLHTGNSPPSTGLQPVATSRLRQIGEMLSAEKTNAHFRRRHHRRGVQDQICPRYFAVGIGCCP
ncbi:hypothetical protein G6K93_31395 [Agrobacterium rhizogenes]|nr:hypothetical protein [Rhizobium rhizogenes]